MYHRFFELKDIIKEEFVLSKDNAAHAGKVLRVCRGETVVVCDGEMNEYLCIVERVDGGNVALRTVEKRRNNSEPAVELTLFQSIVKGDKMDFIIQKGVELGFCAIVPVETERSIARLKDMGTNKIERWRKIARSAAEQCGRGIIPDVSAAVTLKQAAEHADKMKLFVAYEDAGDEKSLKAALREAADCKACGVFIGPEGGFERREVDMLERCGAEVVSLGRRILRAETAGIAFAAVFFYETEYKK